MTAKEQLSPVFVDLYRKEISDIGELRSKMVKSLYQWWSGYQDRLPLKTEFDIVDHAPLAANLFLYKVLGPGSYEYRLNGEAVIVLTGMSQSGRIFSQDDVGEEPEILSEYLNMVVESRRAWTCGGSLAHLGRKHLKFESIDCPLAGPDGEISHILGLMVDLGSTGEL